MGLAAPLSTSNYEDSDRLYPSVYVWKHGPSTERAALEKAWDVTGQVDLPQVLVDLPEGGHREHLRLQVGYPPLAPDPAAAGRTRRRGGRDVPTSERPGP